MDNIKPEIVVEVCLNRTSFPGVQTEKGAHVLIVPELVDFVKLSLNKVNVLFLIMHLLVLPECKSNNRHMCAHKGLLSCYLYKYVEWPLFG